MLKTNRSDIGSKDVTFKWILAAGSPGLSLENPRQSIDVLSLVVWFSTDSRFFVVFFWGGGGLKRRIADLLYR